MRSNIGHVTKNQEVSRCQSHSANFGPIAWKRIEPGNTILESMSYSFPSDQTKIGGVSLILDTAIASRQISKPGSTSAARNSALNTPILLCHTYSEPSGHKDSLGTHLYIPYLFKNWANRDRVIHFLGYFWWFLRSAISKTWVFCLISMHYITLYIIE